MLADRAVLVLLAANLAVLGAAAAIWLSTRPAAVIFLTLLSPCCSSVLKGNSPEAEMAEGGIGGYLRVGLLCVAGMAGLLAWVRVRLAGGREGRLPGQFLLLGVFLVAALASAAWSVDPPYTLIRAGSFVALTGVLAGVLVWSRQPGGPERVLNAAFVFFAAWALANLASLAWPARAWWWDVPSRFQGLTDHPNSVGGCCMIAYPLFLWQFMRRRGLARLGVGGLVAICAAMQVMSGSRSSLLGAAAGILIFLLAAGERRWALAFGAAAFLGLAALAARPPESLQRQFGDESALTLTGRPDIWSASWRLFERRPLAGYGFETQNKLLQDPEIQKVAGVSWTVIANQSTHNGYLSVLLGSGVVAFLLWLTALSVPYVRTWGLAAGQLRAVVLAIMSMSLLTNFVESLITGGSSLPAPLFWMAWVLGTRLYEMAGERRPERVAEPKEEAAYAS